ncbi:MAG: 2-succinyl-5-enolpyruvyl-6-hydroxy-3-cyclohexene-carboxylate synthase [Thermoanaerobaculia bacterium]|jgi:2-succinyl-5-enolpyruvyl-6-hydroxy-3-cyclohexene-1-carboxylate synthase|nr:2-succinyl-5-enolpyruvyl-6-hydroxy-3-cyclohexene-carboxylate synthase [Thermoanaerobaculia bacterium]
MTNIAEARRAIEGAVARGAADFCVCAGSRNAPLLAVLGASDLRIFSFVDERSAAFFALGRAKLTGRPAVVVTTSGTAVAELLPAAIEAHYSATPLIFITADRPARYRGTGAPQAIEQEEIFGVYGRGCVQHINIEFDEPLIDDAISSWDRGRPARSMSSRPGGLETSPQPDPNFPRPLVLLGGLHEGDRDRVRDFAIKLNAPVYAEPLSGLREDPAIEHLLITAGERMIGRGGFDGVIRIGNVPTLRFWRELDESRRDLPLISFSALQFTGCTRGEVHPIDALPDDVARRDRDERFFAADREQAAAIERILDDEPQSELALLRAVSRTIPDDSRVYLGNSLPIREWDLAATRASRGFTIEANRGANGIDGQISTFFGQCDPSRTNVCVVGDLTAIYDSNAPWIVPQLDPAIDARIVIVNNSGGRIFSRVASLKKLDESTRERIIENVHNIRFEHWAAMWGMGHSLISDVRNINPRSQDAVIPSSRSRPYESSSSRDVDTAAKDSEESPAHMRGPGGGKGEVIELRPDPEASRRAWARYDALW